MSWIQHLLTFLTGGVYRGDAPPPPPQKPPSRREQYRRDAKDVQDSLVVLRRARNGAHEVEDATCRIDTNDERYREILEAARNGKPG